MNNLLEMFLELEKIKDVKRYGLHHKVFRESVADHTFLMIVIGTKLMEDLKLNLDYKKVVKLITYHDICELGLASDFDAEKAKTDKDYHCRKKETERKTIENLSNKYGKEFLELYNEYERQQTQEAKFVKAIDKLETNIHEAVRGMKYIINADFTALYPKDAVKNFPLLLPFYREVLAFMKIKYIEAGLPWKEEYERID